MRFPEFLGEGEWEEKPLGTVATLLKGKGISKADIIQGGSLPCVRYGELYTHYNETINSVISYTNAPPENLVLSKANDVIIPSSGETHEDIAKASCVLNNGIALGGDLNIIRTNVNGVFLSYYLNNAKKKDIARLAQGVAVIHLYPSQLVKLIIAIPKPKEQQKIADCLSSVEDVINAQRQKLAALKSRKKGLMQQLLPAGGENSPKLRFPEFNNTGDWGKRPLGEVAEIITGNTPSTMEPANYGGKRMFVSPVDITDFRFLTRTKTTLSELGYSKARHVKENSVLFVCIGSTIGKVVQNKIECATNQQINAVVPNEGYSSDFIFSILENNASNIASMASRHAIPIINKSDFSSILVSFPLLKEQQKIADCLSSIDELISAQSQKIDALVNHKKGLMQQLFPSTNDMDK